MKKKCEICGRKYRVPPYRAFTAKTCSNKCRVARHSRINAGRTGSGWVARNGYRYISIKKRSVLEHRHLLNAKRGDEVHHINGIRTDNRLENLKITTRAEHARHHALKRWGHKVYAL